ncbi:MAG: hypothetical protein ACPG5T_01120 [Endozoicomonas sp.]
MKKIILSVATSSMLLLSASAMADRDYVSEAMKRHGVTPTPKTLFSVINTRSSMNEAVVPTMREKRAARKAEWMERKGS